jgi:hypothetical protein
VERDRLSKPSDLGKRGGGEEQGDLEIRTADESGVTVTSVSGRLDSVTSAASDSEVEKHRLHAGRAACRGDHARRQAPRIRST